MKKIFKRKNGATVTIDRFLRSEMNLDGLLTYSEIIADSFNEKKIIVNRNNVKW